MQNKLPITIYVELLKSNTVNLCHEKMYRKYQQENYASNYDMSGCQKFCYRTTVHFDQYFNYIQFKFYISDLTFC